MSSRYPDIHSVAVPLAEESPSSIRCGRTAAHRPSGVPHLLILAWAAALVCIGAPWIHAPVRLVYNSSPSVARGWYLMVPASRLEDGMLVVAGIPAAAARIAAERDYLPITVPVVKRIAAQDGEHVCEHSRILSIDGRPVARALVADSAGRPLPAWSGCRNLATGEYLLLGDGRPDSYDSRYFGAVTASAILGRAIPLWTWR
ncbi:MAG: S26 family signal peptidase [Steroidobacteraceae bacterium]